MKLGIKTDLGALALQHLIIWTLTLYKHCSEHLFPTVTMDSYEDERKKMHVKTCHILGKQCWFFSFLVSLTPH